MLIVQSQVVLWNAQYQGDGEREEGNSAYPAQAAPQLMLAERIAELQRLVVVMAGFKPGHDIRAAYRASLMGGLGANDRNVSSAAAFGLEPHNAFAHGEDGVVLTHAYASAGMPLRSALPQDDVAGDDLLPAELLDPEAPARGIASIAG